MYSCKMAEIEVAELLAKLVNKVEIKNLATNIQNELFRLWKELNIGSIVSRNVPITSLLDITDAYSQFSPVGEGAFGECYLVQLTEKAPPFITKSGKFIAKKIKEGDQQKIVEEIARILLITNLGHYGIIESHTFEHEGKTCALVACEFDSSQNMTVYATMKYIEGTSLDETIENNELTDFHKLRIAVRVADTLNFLHSYKLAHCDLHFANIMLKQGTNDPVLIDLGNMRTISKKDSSHDHTQGTDDPNLDFSQLDDSGAYHAMIYKMYRHCRPSEIPPVVKPIFDNWDDFHHTQMSFCDITENYFGHLSAYNTTISITDGATGYSNILPCKRVGNLFITDFKAARRSKSFTDYLESSKAGTKLAEQDKMIRQYIQILHIDNKHQVLQPPFRSYTDMFV